VRQLLELINNQWVRQLSQQYAFNSQPEAVPAVQVMPQYGRSYRENAVINGNGIVNDVNGVTVIEVALTADSVWLESYKRARVNSLGWAQAVINVKIPIRPSGTQIIRWGAYYAGNNGFYFGLDATGLFAAVIRAGIESKTYLGAAWETQIEAGATYGIEWTGNNYAPVEFSIYGNIGSQIGKLLTFTKEIPNGAIELNLPLAIELRSNGIASNLTAQFGQRAIYIDPRSSIAPIRTLSATRRNITVSSATNVGLIAVRSLIAFKGRPNSVESGLHSISVSCRTNGATFWLIENPPNLAAVAPTWTAMGGFSGDTSVESNVSFNASAVTTTGIKIINSWQCAANQDRIIFFPKEQTIPNPIVGNVVLIAQSLAANSTVDVSLTIEERW
jgi:hypothetical protein